MANQHTLEEMLRLYHRYTKLQIFLIDREYRFLMTSCMDYDDISFSKIYDIKGVSNAGFLKAQQESIRNNVECVYTNELGLSYIVYSPNFDNLPPGSIQAGPFWFREPQPEQLLKVCQRYNVSDEEIRAGISNEKAIPVLSEEEVYANKRLLFFMFSSLNYNAGSINEDMVQRARILDAIQHYKQEPTVPPYPYDLEGKLHMLIKTRNLEEAKHVLYDLEGYETTFHADDFPKLRMHFLQLCWLMSRAAISGGADDAIVSNLVDQFMLRICSLNTIPEVSSCLRESLDAYTDFMFFNSTATNIEIIRKAVSYITTHFDTHISLKEISEYLHLNPSYFSAMFHKQVGKTFKEFLTQVRIEQSKVLLATTDYSMLNIALSIGFEDQAYFTKVFREHTDTTPAQYRKICTD